MAATRTSRSRILVEVALQPLLVGPAELGHEPRGPLVHEVENALPRPELEVHRRRRGWVHSRGDEVPEELGEGLPGAHLGRDGHDISRAVGLVGDEVASVGSRDREVPGGLDPVDQRLEGVVGADLRRHQLVRGWPVDPAVRGGGTDAAEQGARRADVEVVGPSARRWSSAVLGSGGDAHARDHGHPGLHPGRSERRERGLEIIARAHGVRDEGAEERVVVAAERLPVEHHQVPLRRRGLCQAGRASSMHSSRGSPTTTPPAPRSSVRLESRRGFFTDTGAIPLDGGRSVGRTPPRAAADRSAAARRGTTG